MVLNRKTLDSWLAILAYGAQAGILIEPTGPLSPLSPEASSWRQRCVRIALRGNHDLRAP
jgi:hypothetical protein